MTNRPHSGAASAPRSSLAALLPVDAAPFKRPSTPWFVWSTVILLWLVSLLPWRSLTWAPDLLLLVIAFWCMHEPRRINLLTAFMLGLLMDVHDAGVLGAQALQYTLAAYGTLFLSRRMSHFHVVIQAVHLLPVFFLAQAAARVAQAWLVGAWSGWDWVWSALFTVALWPLADVLLLMPQRRLDEADASST